MVYGNIKEFENDLPKMKEAPYLPYGSPNGSSNKGVLLYIVLCVCDDAKHKETKNAGKIS